MSNELVLRLNVPHILNPLVEAMFPYWHSEIDYMKAHCLEWCKEQIKLQRGLEILIPRLYPLIDRALLTKTGDDVIHQDFYRDILIPHILDNGECEITATIPDFFQTLELRFR